MKGFFTDLRSEVIAPSNDLWVERSYDFIDRCSLHPFSGGCEGSIVPFDGLFAGFYDGRIPLSCHVFSDWILPDRETKKVEAHVAVAFLLCFKGVGVSCFGIFQFSSHAFEPCLDSLFTPLDAFPRIVEDDKVIGVSDAEGVLVDSYPVFPPKYWSTCFLHYIFETVERDIC